MFKSAKERGYGTGFYMASIKKDGALIEEVVFVCMDNNPYKKDHLRREYIEGVSEAVNDVGRARNRRNNG